nr:MAG TPA: hypothetical protein [Caudoviricetes sp.]
MEKFTKEQMKEFSKAIVPAIEMIKSIKKNRGVTGLIVLNISDEWADVYGSSMNDWKLTKMHDGKYRIEKKETELLFDEEDELNV